MIRATSDGSSSDGVPPPRKIVSALTLASADRWMSVINAST
jgi:hypothetical protein